MPYVDPERRRRIDDAVRDLVAAIVIEHNKIDHGGNGEAACLTTKAGLLNYAVTKTILALMGKPRYWKFPLLKGVLVDVIDEFNRKVVAKYEDAKAAENGEVYP